MDSTEQIFFVDALAYHFYQQERFSLVGEMYQYFQDQYGYFSPFIESMLREEPEYQYIGKGILKVAVVIPAGWRDNPSFLDELPKEKVLHFATVNPAGQKSALFEFPQLRIIRFDGVVGSRAERRK